MLLVPRALALPDMLQTIYETEPCVSSADGGKGREPALELLSRAQGHAMPAAGEKHFLTPFIGKPMPVIHPHTSPHSSGLVLAWTKLLYSF